MELKPDGINPINHGSSLLIVPYGIETAAARVELSASAAFNRTLWN